MAGNLSPITLTPKQIEQISKFMHRYLVNNKAKGKLAEAEFSEFFSSQIAQKREFSRFTLISGVWIFSPKRNDFYKHRTAFIRYFPNQGNEDRLKKAVIKLVQALKVAGIKSVIFKPEVELNHEISINLKLMKVKNSDIYETSADTSFNENDWPRGNLRKIPETHQNAWDLDIDTRFKILGEKNCTELLNLFLDEYFLSKYLREDMKINIADPYDTDGFIIDLEDPNNKKIWPIELKEKSAAYDFPFFPHEYINASEVLNHFIENLSDIETLRKLNTKPNNDPNNIYFGLDGGRILMMLRICLPLNTEGIYVVRRMRNSRISLKEILGDSKASKLKKIGITELDQIHTISESDLLRTFLTKTNKHIISEITEKMSQKDEGVNIKFSEIKGIGDKKADELKQRGLSKLGDLKDINTPEFLSALTGINSKDILDEISIFRNFELITKKNSLKFHFLEWRVTTLSSILLGSSWNPIGGGVGMTGGATSTFTLTLNEFNEFSGNFEKLMQKISSTNLVESLRKNNF